MGKIKYAVFDVGQTVYSFTLKPLNALMAGRTMAEREFFLSHDAYHYDYRPYMRGEISDEAFVRGLCAFCRVHFVPELLGDVNKALHEGVGEVFVETRKAMELFYQRGIEIALLSNALPMLADTGEGLVRKENIFTSYELGMLKPAAEIYQCVARKLGVLYEEMVFIDDKEANVAAACRLGINGIVYSQETILDKIKPFLG